MNNQEIINDISFLYELSLTVGKSLELEKNAESFITALMRRKSLSYAALWIKAEKLAKKGEGGFYKRVYAYPGFRAKEATLDYSSFIHKILAENDIYVTNAKKASFSGIYHGEESVDGRLALLRLGDLGFLKLYSIGKKENLEINQLYKLNKVLDRFADSIKACIIHEQLLREIEERRQIETELRNSKEVEEQLFANMSHEIRTPLNGILGMMNLMLTTELTTEQREYTEDMMLSSKTLLAILNDILDYTKIQQGKIVLERLRFDIHAQLNSLYKMAQARSERGNVLVKLDLDIKVPRFVMGDQFRFDQVMNNLISNALKFTAQGEIRIIARYLGEENGKDYLLFKVQDTGIGIPEDKQEKIFSNFIQAESSTSRKFGGTGLGLSIVRQLLELMGGEIRLDSEPGVGSTFFFTLPFEKCKQDLPKDRPSQGLSRVKELENLRVLLVEDTPMNQKVGKRILKKWGAEVELAENGLEAFEKCSTQEYDMILMDLQMPVMSGYEAAKKIRQELPSPMSKVPIIALTAAVRETVKKEVLESGMDTYVMKPFEPENLLGKIRFYLNKRSRKKLHKQAASIEKKAIPPIDTSYLEEIAGEDKQFIEDMLALFIDQAPMELESLGKQIEMEAWDLIHQHAHKLKYPYTSVGREDLVKRLANIEKNAQDQRNIHQVLLEYAYVRDETDVILQALKERTRETES